MTSIPSELIPLIQDIVEIRCSRNVFREKIDKLFADGYVPITLITTTISKNDPSYEFSSVSEKISIQMVRLCTKDDQLEKKIMNIKEIIDRNMTSLDDITQQLKPLENSQVEIKQLGEMQGEIRSEMTKILDDIGTQSIMVSGIEIQQIEGAELVKKEKLELEQEKRELYRFKKQLGQEKEETIQLVRELQQEKKAIMQLRKELLQLRGELNQDKNELLQSRVTLAESGLDIQVTRQDYDKNNKDDDDQDEEEDEDEEEEDDEDCENGNTFYVQQD